MVLHGDVATAFGGPAAARLRDHLHGELITCAHPGYDQARAVHNAVFDRRPTAIVRAADAADVAAAIRCARELELPVAVRGGGHSLACHGTADGALLVDLSAFRGVAGDAARGIARAGGGCTAAELTAAVAEAGLATPLGDTQSVGIGGLTLGGGIGFLARRLGLTIDQLVSVDLVTAEGRRVTASADENSDLFWGLRGGGGDFGVATAFEYRVHPLSTVCGGALVQPATRNLLRAMVPLAGSAPVELTTIATLMHAPPAPCIPPDRVGELAVATLAAHAGDEGSAAEALAPFRSVARAIADTIRPIPIGAMYGYTREGSIAGNRSTGRTLLLTTFDDDVIETLLDFMSRATSPAAIVQLRVLDGAVSAVATDTTAFAHREGAVMLGIIVPFVGPAPAEAHRAWTDDLYGALHPRASGAYVNFLGDEGEGRVREAYPAPTHARLAALKRVWDPANVFRFNQNIRPA